MPIKSIKKIFKNFSKEQSKINSNISISDNPDQEKQF